MGKPIHILNVIIVLLSLVNCAEKQEKGKTDIKNTRRCSCITKVSNNYLGQIQDTTGIKYHVYSSFNTFSVASGKRGISKIILKGKNTQLAYNLDLPEELPISIDTTSNSLIYCKDSCLFKVTFISTNILLCSPYGCAESYRL